MRRGAALAAVMGKKPRSWLAMPGPVTFWGKPGTWPWGRPVQTPGSAVATEEVAATMECARCRQRGLWGPGGHPECRARDLSCGPRPGSEPVGSRTVDSHAPLSE